MSRFWSPVVHHLTPYIPGEQPQQGAWVKLNTNENPYPPSAQAIKAMREVIDGSLRLYPDPEAVMLKRTLAEFLAVEDDQIFVGNGSDEVLALSFFAFFQQEKPVLIPDITYSFYPVYCRLYGIAHRIIPLDQDLGIHVDDYPVANGGIMLANPNTPTGRLLPLAAIERLLAKNTDSVILIDEAYIDFGGDTAVPLLKKYTNLLIVRTLSKSYALAGLRVGFAMGSSELIAGLERVKNSFNSYPLDRIAQVGAVAALRDHEWFERTRNVIIRSRKDLVYQLQQRDFEVLPSSANFVFARHSRISAIAIAELLRRHQVLVRHFQQTRIENYLRFSVGTDNQHRCLLIALDQILSEV